MRHYVIGDVRGNLSMMKKMLDKIGPTEDDWILFTGSLLGPGPDSKGVVNFAMDLKQNNPDSFHFLVGCYENLLRKVIAENAKYVEKNLWKEMGGIAVLTSYATGVTPQPGMIGPTSVIGLDFAIPKSHIDFFEQEMKLYYKHDDLRFIVYHAGPDPTHEITDPDQEVVVTGMNQWWDLDFRSFTHKIIFSHIPWRKPLIKPNILGIDLGCGMWTDGKLCAYDVEGDKFIIEGGEYVN